MKQLTFSKRIQDWEFDFLEQTYGIKIPQYFTDFMQIYASSGVIERVYKGINGQNWKIGSFCPYKTMYEYVGEFLENNLGIKVPFAFDYGGWIFCICLDENDYNSVYIYRSSDHLPKDAFLRIADSFEDFIDRLQPESEVS